jgi:hypothetical protein
MELQLQRLVVALMRQQVWVLRLPQDVHHAVKVVARSTRPGFASQEEARRCRRRSDVGERWRGSFSLATSFASSLSGARSSARDEAAHIRREVEGNVAAGEEKGAPPPGREKRRERRRRGRRGGRRR